MSSLNNYMDEAKISDALLAEKVRCDRSMIAKVRAGKATPSLRLAVAISRETGVPVESLLPCEAAE
jgi:transcriptional regulator with XRE-family HTH domain